MQTTTSTLLQNSTSKLSQMQTLIDNLLTTLDKLNSIDYENLPSNEKMKLNSSLAYVYCTLEFSLLGVENKSVKSHVVMKELERVRLAMNRLNKK
ncbi:Uncharacterized protein QTN25_006750 [Entamoeba marina]